ncbi:response regulator transcription factor [Flavobacterium sp. CYK-4]|uniref:response regulator transcription factor n=1 Tax=Flavobacterium lotistagni TaxID=2709660 RepID=UPI00140DFB9E|nr:response regulator transcription factor [Flavobacterium lotistagni]NHM06894.1 response regulator transcription factor [Flavobacterium lotistagni]
MKILIVEDETGIANFLQQGLEEEGYEVIATDDGRKGFEITQQQKVDLILLDWMLPKMSGIEICKAIRQVDTTTPIIFLTAKDTVEETIEGLKAGANDYIKKPFSFEELIMRIKVHLRAEQQDDTLTLGDISIVQSKYQVLMQQQEVLLTQREYELLVYLIKHKEKVCTRNQIISEVWNIHYDYDSGVIDVFINAIRKKLGINKEALIKTIRGVGYIASENT